MNKNFLAKVVFASVLLGGVNLLPVPNFDVGNIEISVAYAERKNFSAKEGAMTDVELIESQAKEASRLRAIEAVKEKIASYIRNFSGAKGKLSEDDISAIAEKYEEVGTAKYKKLFYNAVDEDGKELGKVGIMYEATVTAKFNSKKITEYIKLTEAEKVRRIRQARESREKFEELDREYEELRKNARTKTPEQLQSEIKDFDDKISDLAKSRGKNKSAKKDKPVKKDKPTTQQDKNQPMKFSNPVEIGYFGNGERFTGTLIKGASYANETPRYVNDHGMVYSKGIARFGEGNDAIYLHYGNSNFKLGSEDLKNTISYDYGYGATILKVSATNGYTMYFLKKVYYVPSTCEFYILIGRRPDGKWVKYFDTEDLCKQYFGNSKNISIQKVTSNGDTIIAHYVRNQNSNVNESGEFRFKWDESAKWFGVEKITYNQKPTEHKTVQENKQVTNQPIKFSQPVKLGGGIRWSQAGGFMVWGDVINNKVEKDFFRMGKKSNFSFSKGVAQVGTGVDAIYEHYDTDKSFEKIQVGSYDIKNTITVSGGTNDSIYKIDSNIDVSLYMILEMEEFDQNYVIFGKRNDGRFVKYIDTGEIRKQYFGEYGSCSWSKIQFQEDTITIPYGEGGYRRNFTTKGEFRFKWDEKAQWFSIEHIKY